MTKVTTTIIVILATVATVLLLVKCAMVSVDRMTVRDCERGIKAACEEVERLNLK